MTDNTDVTTGKADAIALLEVPVIEPFDVTATTISITVIVEHAVAQVTGASDIVIVELTGVGGSVGPPGMPGEKWFSAPGAPTTVAGSVNGDFYLDETNGDVYELIVGVWTLTANIKGPAGSQGIPGNPGTPGTAGAPGTPGEVWFSGSSNPTSVPGAINNDWYLNTTSGDVFELVTGVWTLRGNIKGPQGIQGIQGSQGVPGTPVDPATATPLMDGVGAVGSTTKYAREDHRHPSDTAKADITAIPAPATVAPLMDGVAAVGTATKYAREDHRHPTDTSIPAPATVAPLAQGIAAVGTTVKYAREDHIHPGRERLLAVRTYYVRVDGSDANTGLADTAGGAKLTIGAAIAAWAALDNNGQATTIIVRAGTFGFFNMLAGVGNGSLTVEGDNTTPANVVLNGGLANNSGYVLNIRGFRLHGIAGHGIYIGSQSSVVITGNMDFGTVSLNHITLAAGSSLTCNGRNITISGNAASGAHWAIAGSGADILAQSNTYNIPAPVSVSVWASTQVPGGMTINANTFTGAANVTGQKYNITANGVCQTFGGGPNYLPGTIAGATSTGGQYL